MKANKITLLLFVTFFLASQYSCTFLDTEKTTYADVYITVRISGLDTLYALEAYAESNYTMDYVELKNETNASFSYNLEAANYFKAYYQVVADVNNFSAEIPTASTYLFIIDYNDETTDTIENVLTSSIILPPVISEIVSDTTDNSITISWDEVENSDMYTVKMFQNDTLVYLSGLIDESYSSLTITSSSSGWDSYFDVESGDLLEVMVVSVLAESGSSTITMVQSLALSDTISTVWP